jgi:hypothetical protein
MIEMFNHHHHHLLVIIIQVMMIIEIEIDHQIIIVFLLHILLLHHLEEEDHHLDQDLEEDIITQDLDHDHIVVIITLLVIEEVDLTHLDVDLNQTIVQNLDHQLEHHY